eukprot:COSAG01_NODE_6562_length_3608_cov_4.538900_1_plen_314_part_00
MLQPSTRGRAQSSLSSPWGGARLLTALCILSPPEGGGRLGSRNAPLCPALGLETTDAYGFQMPWELSGPVEDACVSVEDVRRGQAELGEILSELVSQPFFRIFKVSSGRPSRRRRRRRWPAGVPALLRLWLRRTAVALMALRARTHTQVNLARACKFFPDDGTCGRESCAVSTCCEEEIPLPWRYGTEKDTCMAVSGSYKAGRRCQHGKNHGTCPATPTPFVCCAHNPWPSHICLLAYLLGGAAQTPCARSLTSQQPRYLWAGHSAAVVNCAAAFLTPPPLIPPFLGCSGLLAAHQVRRLRHVRGWRGVGAGW